MRLRSLAALLAKLFEQCVSIVSLVGDGGSGVQSIDELIGPHDVIFLPRPANQPDGKAQRIARSMDFRAQSAPRPAQALGMRPPFTLRAPAAC